ncbi:S-adenosyl-L-methionine-dependent methyltransferase [Rhodocollybia butyracea]|uniref:S-adenosyl-L-methionine-dependent methyltransferase n=1 Tax=Rhodocollybia butyracea TaxID=206335 RepID=A0A9P5P8X3_9AGAR|nr:S-adenosyl-L-methionine-dependent methyltransferase [Rhodocollybia butyracea]
MAGAMINRIFAMGTATGESSEILPTTTHTMYRTSFSPIPKIRRYDIMKKRRFKFSCISGAEGTHKSSKPPSSWLFRVVMDFDNSHITALTDLINAAVHDVITEYAAVGMAVPTLGSLTRGPFDSPEGTPEKFSRAVQVIEAACMQLTLTVTTPAHVVVNRSLQHEESACLSVVTEAKIADLLLNKPNGVHVDELAELTGLDGGKLGRILRVLATKHCFREVKPGVFANNRLSLKLQSTEPVAAYVSLLADEGLLASAHLKNTMNMPLGRDSCTPFQHAKGHNLYHYYTLPEGKKQGERFNHAMVGGGELLGQGMVARVYPWASVPADSIVCDVAGGNGHATMRLIKAHPHLRVTLQDQPEVISEAKKFWKNKHPEAIDNKRINFVTFDFLKDVAAEGCDFYYMRSILRGEPDSHSYKILQNVRKAMKPTSRLIIEDTVLKNTVRDCSSEPDQVFDQAPEPLLPNWGAAGVRANYTDMNMMNLLDGLIRTLPEFVELW